jgi:hypothetical protein
MKPFRDDNDLIAELRALRPTPAPEFTAVLDERAAAGFPRRSASSGVPLAGVFARLRALPPRRFALAGGGVALATIAVATALVVANDTPKTNTSGTLARLSPSERPSASLEAQPHRRIMGTPNPAHEAAEPRSSSSDNSGGSSGIQYESVPPDTGSIPSSKRKLSSAEETSASAALPAVKTVDGSGPYVVKADHRDVERSAEMVLGADPDRVADDAGQVFDAVHAADGIVLSSSVTGGGTGDAGARFELLIPAAKLGDALAAFSSIDAVVSRHEATDDITAPTVRIGEQLRDSRATIDGLLVQLAGADSDGERAEVEAELRAERRRAAALRSRAAKLDRRANLSRVSLRIETGNGAATGDSGGGWGIGDALHDAGQILAVAAGVAIVGLAIVGPLALLALLVWFANRGRLRRAREHALK